MNINELKHRELDALVDEKVMGDCVHDWELQEDEDDPCSGIVWRKCKKCNKDFWGLRPPVCRYYSTDIAAAMQLVDKMRERGIYITIVPQKDDYLIAVSEYHPQFNSYSHLLDLHADNFEELPEAICRAALKAVEA